MRAAMLSRPQNTARQRVLPSWRSHCLACLQCVLPYIILRAEIYHCDQVLAPHRAAEIARDAVRRVEAAEKDKREVLQARSLSTCLSSQPVHPGE